MNERQTPVSKDEDLAACQVFAQAEARPLTITAAAELKGAAPTLLQDDEETDIEFAHRSQSFAALLSLIE